MTQLHVISPIHAEVGLNLTAIENTALARGSALAAATAYIALKQGLDVIMNREDSPSGTKSPEVEYRPDPVPIAAAAERVNTF